MTGADLVAFGQSAWWTSRPERSFQLRETAFARLVEEGLPEAAGKVAVSHAWDFSARGQMAPYQGWMAKAERVLEGREESPSYAYLLVVRGFNLMESGNVAEGLVDLQRAEGLGGELRLKDVVALARIAQGTMKVRSGQVDEGLAMLDEVTASAVSGELPAFESGLIYCVTISTCHDVGDVRRAAEWTEAASAWCDQHDLTGFPGACRIHRAQLLRLRGLWTDAERQCQAACEELADYNAWITAEGRYEIAEIRRRRGEFGAALEGYRDVAAVGMDPQPGLALLRLAEGKVDTAAAALRRSLAEGGAPLGRMALLPAQVEVALAAGDLATARAAAAELEATITAYRIGDVPAPAFQAQLHLATGRIQLAEGDWAAAARSLRLARSAWQQIGAPYEVAQARMLLGLAYRHEGDEDGATGELEAAQSTFARLGARLEEERAKELLGRLETRRTFVFTDIVGSTELARTLGDEKWRRLLARHDQLLRERITEAGGEVIKQTGDGFFAAFERPRAAVQAAVAIQRALAEEVVAPDVRIGVHTGGAFHPDGDASDYAGQGVHMAARIGAAAGAGEILVSAETLDGTTDTGSLSEPRALALKGFEDPVPVVAVRWS
ncbi:adenylate/guanylate cyclase domain-containing protein [Ornithinimicrobium tianjinense]|uniref:Helix-turn-helix transcriptional regulator n=1 Tax=Ornithinimicrobium tianjinense TaxID=1195761 RepID=A0A917BU61_9MICO|nr:adenylate/guanylate cyclase domain-containing protein [Ornithinimicrobium tianjinense]GGF56010.1 helix-turn-helix transcriptional regulator [Ornithinimicrobium tianjinense]